MTEQTYDDSFGLMPINHSCLFNAMIHPFTDTQFPFDFVQLNFFSPK
jgi:hypothetical protein